MDRPRMILLGSAAVFAVAGVAFSFFPQQILALVAVDLGSPAALGDVRAVYGGLEIGVAIVLVRAAADPSTVRLGLACAATLFASMAVVRAFSIAVDGVPQPIGFVLLGAETVGAIAALWGYRAADE